MNSWAKPSPVHFHLNQIFPQSSLALFLIIPKTRNKIQKRFSLSGLGKAAPWRQVRRLEEFYSAVWKKEKARVVGERLLGGSQYEGLVGRLLRHESQAWLARWWVLLVENEDPNTRELPFGLVGGDRSRFLSSINSSLLPFSCLHVRKMVPNGV